MVINVLLLFGIQSNAHVYNHILSECIAIVNVRMPENIKSDNNDSLIVYIINNFSHALNAPNAMKTVIH